MRSEEFFVEQPIRSLQTMLQVLAEDDGRLPTVVPDGLYGPSTMQAISAFQRRHGLPITGVTDQQTWETIVRSYEDAVIRVEKAEPIEIIMDAGSVYRLGDQGPYIYLLQSMLIQLATEHPRIRQPEHNGIFDDLTVEAITDFQVLAGLPVTGELDKITWKHLSKQYSLYAHHATVRGRASLNDPSRKSLATITAY